MDWLQYHEEPVILSSGLRSHWMMRGDLIFQDEKLREIVLGVWERALRHYPRPLNFIGVPTGGIPWAEAIAERTQGFPLKSVNEAIQIEKERKGDGLLPGSNIIVEDVITTGGNVMKLLVQTAPLEMVATICVVARTPGIPTLISWWCQLHLPLEGD